MDERSIKELCKPLSAKVEPTAYHYSLPPDIRQKFQVDLRTPDPAHWEEHRREKQRKKKAAYREKLKKKIKEEGGADD